MQYSAFDRLQEYDIYLQFIGFLVLQGTSPNSYCRKSLWILGIWKLFCVPWFIFKCVVIDTRGKIKNTINIIKIRVGRAVVAHTFNPRTWEAEAGEFLSSRPVWSTE